MNSLNRILTTSRYVLLLLFSVAILALAGCGGADAPAGGGSASGSGSTGTETPPNAADSGSIIFVSATPATISLRGTGGINNSETSQVIFKVLDTANNPVADKSVTFSLTTQIGGLKLLNTSGTTDSNGEVGTFVISGIIGTPVRVLASTITDVGDTITTLSDQLVVSTGLPDSDSFTLSVTKFNIEAWGQTDVTTELTVNMADHFNNPVPDGTAVSFFSEDGQLSGSCTTVDSQCSVTYYSGGTQPADQLVTILARAVGEESFYDNDSDGLADIGELSDINGNSTDLSEPFLDMNYDGVYDAGTDVPFDYNGNGFESVGDGFYNGPLCNETPDPELPTRVSTAGTCSAQKSLYIWTDTQILLSTSFAGTIAVNSPALGALGGCPGPSGTDVTFLVLDENGNNMPVGTTVSIAADGTILGTPTVSTLTVLNGTQPGTGYSLFKFRIKEGTTCVGGSTGSVIVTVTSPSNAKTYGYLDLTT